ncbi:hypothetical protein HPB49_022557 [Dermacentor silvarum]|uniref:Uncharacterized protein n=1 Tax=Dermacentor silvarum TaxID=543639 RepID=A0ACB8CTJ9_DERSI|nr:hypothetical protein HPB49_022557 [Dermacentor silvarum]
MGAMPPLPTATPKSGGVEPASRAEMVAPIAALTSGHASGTPSGKKQPLVSRAAGSKNKTLTNYKARPFPIPGMNDFVVVLKPREHVSLHQAFSENCYGTTFTAYVWPEMARSVMVLPDSFDMTEAMSATGSSSSATRTLLNRFGSRCNGEQAPLSRGGNLAPLTHLGSPSPGGRNRAHPNATLLLVIPACGLCGAVGHRAYTCSNTQPNTCGFSGYQAPLVEEVRAPDVCVPRCLVRVGGHATNSRECAA